MSSTHDRPAGQAPAKSARFVMHKLPHVTLLFWVLKIVATTLGETGGDLLAPDPARRLPGGAPAHRGTATPQRRTHHPTQLVRSRPLRRGNSQLAEVSH
jgi:hypothetical protein